MKSHIRISYETVLLIVFVSLISSCNNESTRLSVVTRDSRTIFASILSGNSCHSTDTLLVPLTEIDNYQQAVWQGWVEANSQLDEPKLPFLCSLDTTTKDKWLLPDTLEPGATMNFYWGKKGKVAAGEQFSLYLYLHGSGHRDKEWANGIKLCSDFDDAPSAYFIPQIPNMGQYYRWWQKSKQFAWERLLRQAFVSGQIDPDRVYFFGISEGGYGSQRLASFYADYLAAAGPMAGGEPLKNAPAVNCRNIGFSLRTGDLDTGFCRDVLTANIAAEFDSLQQIYPDKYIHHIELISGAGHHIDYKPTTPWLKKFCRNPYPKSVAWENFEMDGVYRKGFYNIEVRERSNEDMSSRTYYEMDIDNNHIDMNVNLVTYQVTEKDPHWGIPLKYHKTFTPATKGKFIIYLNGQLVDLSKEVTVALNGKEVYRGVVKTELRHLINSCATFFDPERIYPAAIEVTIGK